MQEVAKHSAAYKIFNYLVDCTIPPMFLHNPDFVQKFGLFTTMDESIDRQTLQTSIAARLTVAQMAEYHAEGAPIALTVPEEAKQIYGWITIHMGDWQNELAVDPGRTDVPVDDIRMLEQFAEAIYPMARQFITVETSTSSLFRGLDRLGRRAIRRAATQAEKKLPDVPIAHSPMAQQIAAEVARRERR